MDVSRFLKGNYLTAADIDEDGNVTTITGVDTAVFDAVDGTKQEKVVLITEMGSVALNKTNLATIADALGKDASDWQGQLVKLVREKVNFGGKMVDAIRIRCKSKRTKETRPAQSQRTATRPAPTEPPIPTRDDYEDTPF